MTAPHPPTQAQAHPYPAKGLPARSLRWIRLLPVLLPLALFVATGIAGIDFGEHWDEVHQGENVVRSSRDGSLLPGWYRYPSVNFWLSVTAAGPEYASAFGQEAGSQEDQQLIDLMLSGHWHHRARTLYLLSASLAILWVYALVLRWRGSVFEAFLAACALATSWEFAYHSRWIAPDALHAMFAALTLAFALRASLLQAKEPGAADRSRTLAAIAAGLAAGTKYTGGWWVLLPVASWAWARKDAQVKRQAQTLLAIGAAFLLTFLISTPGALFEHDILRASLEAEREHYAEQGHLGYTTDPGLGHGLALARYLGLSLASPTVAIAVLWSLLAAVGALATLRERRDLTVLLVLIPLGYLLYLSSQRVLFVRNLIPVAPFGCVLAARGYGALAGLLRGHAPRLVLGSLLTGTLALDAAHLVTSAARIRGRGEAQQVERLMDWLAARPDTTVWLSPPLREMITDQGRELPASFRPELDPYAHDLMAGYPRHVKRKHHWPANVPGVAVAELGPGEVNWAYYTTWPEDRIVVLTPETWRQVRDYQPPRPDHAAADE